MSISPTTWSVHKLGEIATFHDEKRVPVKSGDRTARRGPYPYYGASGKIDTIDDFLFDGEYLLLAEDGANILDRTSPIVYLVRGKFWVNNHAHILQALPITSNRFLAYALEKLNYEKFNTGSAQPKLNKDVCKLIDVLLPPLEEQERIVEILADADAAIATAEEKLVGLKKKLRVCRVQRIREQIAVCAPTKFADIFSRITTKNDWKSENVLTISAKYGLVNQLEYFNKSVSGKDLSGYYLLQRGDFAYNRSYSDGYPMGAIKSLQSYECGVVSTLYLCFRAKPEAVKHEYVRQYFESGLFNKQLVKIVQEGGRAHGLLNLNLSNFYSTNLFLPSLDVQDEISEHLSLLEADILLQEKLIATLQIQKRGLMQHLLTGKLRVPKN